MAEATMASSWVELLEGVTSESKRIAKEHSRHFLSLALLFLLPLSFLLIASPIFYSSLLHPATSHDPPVILLRRSSDVDHQRPISAQTLTLAILYAAAIAGLYLSALAAVTHSVHQGFFGRPVKLLHALRSLPCSIFRLVLTALVLFGFFALISSLFVLSFRALHHLGFHDLPSPLFWVAGACLGLVAIYLQVNWALAGAVAVNESSFGFEPLRRSAYLVRGMRWAVFFLCLFFSLTIGLMIWSAKFGGVIWTQDWTGMVPVIARVVCASALTMLMLLYSILTNVVLYIYCKALHGELAYEIAAEFAPEYVRLQIDDLKVPRVVSVVRA